MKIYNPTHKSGLSTLLLSTLGVFVLTCCGNESDVKVQFTENSEIAFTASIDKSTTLKSRSGELIAVNPDDFGETPFYIYERGTFKEANNPTGELMANVQPYWIESGTEGQLNIMPGKNKLNWFAADTEHQFWSWTWPLKEQYYSDKNPPKNEAIIFVSSEFPMPDTEDETVTDPTPEQLWRNGEDLERLVGATTDRAYIFNQDGRYVPLTYKHLVSRIVMGEFVLVDNTGAEQTDLKARITFYGMPKRAMFYPLPADADDGSSVAPYVVTDPTDPYGNYKGGDDLTTEEEIKQKGTEFDYNLNEYLTFYITNQGGDNTNTGTKPDADSNVQPDMFYICPGVDFTNLQYKVEFVEWDKDSKTYVTHSKYGTRGGYFGDFKSVQFIRVSDDGLETETTDRILNAGEEMVINMRVYQKSGPGAGVWIRNWSNQKLKSAMHHVHPGIYSDAEASACRDVLGSNSTTAEQKDDAYYIYGEDEDIDDDDELEKVIHIYSDINLSSNTFRAYNNGDTHYIIDGMGYTLTFTNTSTTNPTPYEYFYIGDVRDLYVTNGIYTVYIDKDGYVWRMNEETGKFEYTDEKVTPNTKAIYFEQRK